MTNKEIVLKAIAEMPDEATLQEIANRVRFLAGIRKGLDELDAGEGTAIDEVEKELLRPPAK
jgi:hypothetical protein